VTKEKEKDVNERENEGAIEDDGSRENREA
jgi:hypothetical protein